MHLYVSSDLMHFTEPDDTMLATDISQVDHDKWRVYRRVDKYWYAWLNNKMQRLSTLHKSSQIDEATWQTMRDRFNKIWQLSCDLFGQQEIADAAQIIPAPNYQAPKLHRVI
jgi:hypothetical protein